MILYFVGSAKDHAANSYQAVTDDASAAQQLAQDMNMEVFQKDVDVRPRRNRRKRRHV